MKLNSPRFLSKQQKRIVQEVQLQLSEICDFDLEIPSIERGFPLILNSRTELFCSDGKGCNIEKALAIRTYGRVTNLTKYGICKASDI